MLKRRHFIATGVGAGGIALVLYNTDLGTWNAAPEVGPDALESQALLVESGLGVEMDELLTSLTNSEALGRAWLEEQNPEPSLEQLGAVIASTIDPTAATLSTLTAQQISKDFVQNNLCSINGWQLSMTECQLAALRVLAIDANPANAPLLAARVNAELNAELTIGEIAPLDNWGPQVTMQGVKFNEQRDGHSGLWFQFKGAPGRARIMIDGEYARTNVRPEVVTSGLYGEVQDRILSTPGAYEIALVDPVRKIKQPIGELVVRERHLEFCEITRWGPKETSVGVAANEQPDGSMGVWAFTECVPEDVELRLDDDPLKLTRNDFGFTTSIPLAFIATPGEKVLRLVNVVSSEELVVGHITIR